MKNAATPRRPLPARGSALIEFALAAPVLILLMLGIFDYARAVQANNILINMSREGANLVARTTNNPQYVMRAVADTAEPLDMVNKGGMVITRVMGLPNGKAEVVEQYRWTGGQQRQSRMWSGCGSWSGGSCTVATPRPVVTLPVSVSNDEMVYLVETFYHYDALFGFAMPTDPELYSYTML